MTENINPLLKKLQMPGRIFALPSGGHFYKNGELADSVTDGEVHVHPMSAIAEIYLKNPDQLFSGAAIERVFKECIPDIKKPSELFGKDVDALMCFLRMVTYGVNYEVSARHSCENAKTHSYVIDLEKVAFESVKLDPTLLEKQYSVTLSNGQVVELEPMRFRHVIELLQGADTEGKQLTPEQIQEQLLKNTLMTIKCVDGITDRLMIREWLSTITSPMMNSIAALIDSSNDWGLDYVRTVKCKDCGEEYNLELPVNPISFFSS